MLDAQRMFYQQLYTADGKVSYNLDLKPEAEVPEGLAAKNNMAFTEEEYAVAVKSMKNNSCPGCDGLPVEVYKVFWADLSGPLKECLELSFHEDILHASARQGVVNVIPKGNKDTRYLANLRPITLLNVDYKILEKAVANRMIPALQEIIHTDQKGFLPGRRITANIRRILDVVTHADEKCDGLILSCDYLKCFDMIEFGCIQEAMKLFGFSDTLCKWIRIMYTAFCLKVQNNGEFSTSFVVSRGVHQGGPASNGIFLCVAELIAISLRNDSLIQGIFVKQILHFLNQYADDLDLMLKNTQDNLDRVLLKIQEFHDSTGFTLSYEKTNVYRVGAMKKSQAKLYTRQELNWTNKINVLGVHIRDDKEELLSVNYDSVFHKSVQTMEAWHNRNVSLLGKINIINSLVASLFVYKMSVLPSLPEDFVNKIEQKVNNFLWNSHKPKIPLAVLQMNKEDGGAKLVNLRIKDISLKATWVKLIQGSIPAN